MTIQIRFDGPPGPEAGRFVEVKNELGQGLCVGKWVQDGDYWLLKIERVVAARKEAAEGR